MCGETIFVKTNCAPIYFSEMKMHVHAEANLTREEAFKVSG